MAVEETKSRCTCMGVMEDFFPIVPFIIPLLPMVAFGYLLWSMLKRLERQEALLEEIMAD